MKIGISILLIVTVLATALICIKQPKMHSKVMVYDSQYTLVDNDNPPVEEVFTVEEMPTMATGNDNKVETETFFDEQEAQPKKEINVEKKEAKVTPKVKVNQIAKEKPTTKEVKSPNTKQVETKPVVKTTTAPKVQTQQQPTTVNNTIQQKPVQIQTPTQTQTQKVLTEQEELIAWNKWRSNLQNQIMKDTKLPSIPYGTIFKMSFDVDKSGRISNVQTWSTNSKYTPYAIEYIAPVIKSYQGKSILDFPEGSKRTKTTFTGGWKISQSQKYSTPANYNDVEKVTH